MLQLHSAGCVHIWKDSLFAALKNDSGPERSCHAVHSCSSPCDVPKRAPDACFITQRRTLSFLGLGLHTHHSSTSPRAGANLSVVCSHSSFCHIPKERPTLASSFSAGRIQFGDKTSPLSICPKARGPVQTNPLSAHVCLIAIHQKVPDSCFIAQRRARSFLDNSHRFAFFQNSPVPTPSGHGKRASASLHVASLMTASPRSVESARAMPTNCIR